MTSHLIHDRYLDGTRLRLRRMTEQCEGAAPVFKLGQKVRPDPASAAVVLHTTMYLTEEEFEILSQLPAVTLEKTRYRFDLGGLRFATDVFHGRHDGLALIEADANDEPPPWTGRDVTEDERFTGAGLAMATPDEILQVLAEVRQSADS